ncbi:MAG: nitronate monooxygenase [Phycisphaerales bacterium]|nr:nitronate monooxygenase [Phycisphaerales bacterium]
MGAGVSGWVLARAVSAAGQLGVVSGTALDLIFSRRLQSGDPGGHTRWALEQFPIPAIAQRLLNRYFVAGGKPAGTPFRAKPILTQPLSRHLEELLVVSNFTEVLLARRGHRAPVGINFLEKIQLPTLPSLYGAMLAGVRYVLMGAGIPRAIPGILDRLARGEAAEMRLDVQGAAAGDDFKTRFDPAAFWGGLGGATPPPLERPRFIAIVASDALATMLARKASGRVDGFVVEGPTSGGHNAPPRGAMRLSPSGEPVYTDRDVPDLEAIRALGVPFWLAGSYAQPGRLAEALARGATGVQVGTAFAYCEESGLDPAVRARVLAMSRDGTARVFTDPVASPTGFPFKLVQLEGTLSEPAIYAERRRICDLGYLRQAYRSDDGTVGWRCPSEPVEDYVEKGGLEADTGGRKCLCNGLMANIGLGQVHAGAKELPLVTSGDDVATVARFLPPGAASYTAADVIVALLQVGMHPPGIEPRLPPSAACADRPRAPAEGRGVGGVPVVIE